MKTTLRRIGNSSGISFTKDALAIAGFFEGQELRVEAAPGEIRLTASDPGVDIRFTSAEAKALLEGDLNSAAGKAAVHKLRGQLIKSS